MPFSIAKKRQELSDRFSECVHYPSALKKVEADQEDARFARLRLLLQSTYLPLEM